MNFASTWLLSDHDDFNLSRNILSERNVLWSVGDEFMKRSSHLLDNLSDCLIWAPEKMPCVFNRIQTHDLCDAGALASQSSWVRMPLKTPEIFRNISSMQGISHGSFFFSTKEKIKPSPFACARMAYVDVLLSCGNCDKTLKIKKDCTFEEFRKNVKSIFPHLPKVSKSSQKIL